MAGGLKIGSVFTEVGFRFDDSGVDRYERRTKELRRESHKDIVTDAKVDVDHTGFTRYEHATRQAEHQADGLERRHGRLRGALGASAGAAGIAGAAIGGGLVLGLAKASREYEEAAKAGAQTAAVIKSTGGAANVTADGVERLATSLSNKTGIDDEVIQSGANMLLTFTNIRNEAGAGNDVFNQTTKAAIDMSVAMGTDAKSAALQLGKALNDPEKGMTKLMRSGVTFTDQQKAQVKALQESGKTLEAQKIIIAEVNKEFGGSAEAQARPLDKARVAVNNLFEAVGRRLAPAMEAAANFTAKFIDQLQTGEGAGGAVVKAFGMIVSAGRTVVSWLGRLRDAFSGGNEDASRFAQNVRELVVAAFNAVRSGINRVVSAFRGSSESFAIIGRAIGKAFEVAVAITRATLPGIITLVQGLARVVRGVVDIIAGILSGDFGRIWDGVKSIVRGAVNAITGLLRAWSAPFRTAISAVSRPITDTFGRAWSTVTGVVRSAADKILGFLSSMLRGMGSFVTGASKIPVIGGAFKGLADRVSGAADRIDHLRESIRGVPNRDVYITVHIAASIGKGLQFVGDAIAVIRKRDGGPISKAERGADGNQLRGAQLVMWNEGMKPEWWISQEGPRDKNIQYAKDALQALTGRDVALFADGGAMGSAAKAKPKAPKAPKKAPLAPAFARAAQIAKILGKAVGGLGGLTTQIADGQTMYGQAERDFSLSTEEYLDPDTGEINYAAVIQRGAEIDALATIKTKISNLTKVLRTRLKKAIKDGKALITRLTRALHKAKKTRKPKISQEIGNERAKVAAWIDQAHGLPFALEDLRLDVSSLYAEKAEIAGTQRQPVDTGGGGGSADIPSDPGGGAVEPTSTVAPPSPEDIARAAGEQLAAFQAGRADLFSGFGSNFQAGGGLGLGDPTGAAAGLRFFGATGAAGGSGGGDRILNLDVSFASGPPSPSQFVDSVAWHAQAASIFG